MVLSPFRYVEGAMRITDELWYDNVSPFEQCTRGDKKLKELLKLMARNREEVDASLTEKQKETLEKFEDCMNEMHSITERDAFSHGFRLGTRLIAEAFLLPMGRMRIYRGGLWGHPYKFERKFKVGWLQMPQKESIHPPKSASL